MKSEHAVVRRAAIAVLFLAAIGSASASEGARHGLVSQGIALNGPLLQGINLQGINLQGINLQGINLQGINLQGINLQGINLQGINLQGINLQGINLQGINLQGPLLQGAMSLTAAFEPSGLARAMYGVGQGVFPALPGAADAVPGHSPASGLDARKVRVRLAAH